MAIARAGGAVSFVGAVGDDGAWVVRDIEGYGVSTADISVVQVCPQCLRDGAREPESNRPGTDWRPMS